MLAHDIQELYPRYRGYPEGGYHPIDYRQ